MSVIQSFKPQHCSTAQRQYPNSAGREGIWDFGLRIRNYVEKNLVEYEDKTIAAILRPFHQRDLFREIRGL